MEDLELLKRWGEWLRAIHTRCAKPIAESSSLLGNTKNCRGQREASDGRGLLNQWLATNYVVAATVRTPDSLTATLGAYLGSAADRCRSNHRRTPEYSVTGEFCQEFTARELRETAERDYDKLVGAEQQRADVTFVRCDLARFCAAAATETVREFVNKRAAHWDEAADHKVKLGEVDTALDILSGLVDKYVRLLTGSGILSNPSYRGTGKKF